MELHQPPSRAEISPVLEVRIDRVAKDVEDKLARFETWKRRRLVTDPDVVGGEPTFAKSRLAVRHVGGMLLRGPHAKRCSRTTPTFSRLFVAYHRGSTTDDAVREILGMLQSGHDQLLLLQGAPRCIYSSRKLEETDPRRRLLSIPNSSSASE
jgi:hypothetical protein